MSDFKTINRFEELELGHSYRVTWTMAAKAPTPDQIGRIADVLRNASKLQAYHFDSVEFVPPGDMGGRSSGRKTPWRLSITFHKVGGGTPVFVVIGLIIAALVSIGLVLFGAGYSVEKFAEKDLTPEERIELEKAKAPGQALNTFAAMAGIVGAVYLFTR